MENSSNIVTKTLSIERATWTRVKEIIWEKSGKNQMIFANPSEVLNAMLIRYKNGEVTVNESSKIEKKNVQVKFNPDALEVYEGLMEGGRGFIVNGLLRTWLKENS